MLHTFDSYFSEWANYENRLANKTFFIEEFSMVPNKWMTKIYETSKRHNNQYSLHVWRPKSVWARWSGGEVYYDKIRINDSWSERKEFRDNSCQYSVWGCTSIKVVISMSTTTYLKSTEWTRSSYIPHYQKLNIWIIFILITVRLITAIFQGGNQI